MRDRGKDFDRIAEAQRIIGHTFSDTALIDVALTHPSAGTASEQAAFQRLEFLGDAVVDLVVVEHLFARFPESPEGPLTKLKIRLVSGPALADAMRDVGLADLVAFGASETSAKGRGLTSALADCFEAVVAAVYLDAGIELARRLVLRALRQRLVAGPEAEDFEHPKSALQEVLQARGQTPLYEVTGQTGPAHDRMFAVRVRVGSEVLGEGTGGSKKAAEVMAASEALRVLREQG